MDVKTATSTQKQEIFITSILFLLIKCRNNKRTQSMSIDTKKVIKIVNLETRHSVQGEKHRQPVEIKYGYRDCQSIVILKYTVLFQGITLITLITIESTMHRTTRRLSFLLFSLHLTPHPHIYSTHSHLSLFSVFHFSPFLFVVYFSSSFPLILCYCVRSRYIKLSMSKYSDAMRTVYMWTVLNRQTSIKV